MRNRFSFIYSIPASTADENVRTGIDFLVKGTSKIHKTMSAPFAEKFELDIEEVLFKGVDIYPLICAFNRHDKIESACVSQLFQNGNKTYSDKICKQTDQAKYTAKIINLLSGRNTG